jgi:hypothetical protein
VEVAPVVDGVMSGSEWSEPMVVFDPDDDQSRRVMVYMVKEGTDLYLAFAISDATNNPETDSLKFYLDATRNLGDPDVLDRFFQVVRDGSAAIRSGIGTNTDGQAWDGSYTSNNWLWAVGEAGGQVWVVEIKVELTAEMPVLLDGNPFGMMVNVLYTGSQGNWPQDANSEDAGSWQGITNAVCP